MGKGCKFGFLFIGVLIGRDQDVRIWGVSSCVTSKFEVGFKGLVLIQGAVKWSPTASIWGSFFVKDVEFVSNRGWSFEDELVVFLVGTSPLQGFKLESDRYEGGNFIWVSGVIARSFFDPLCSFEVLFGDVAFSPSFKLFEGCSSQCG